MTRMACLPQLVSLQAGAAGRRCPYWSETMPVPDYWKEPFPEVSDPAKRLPFLAVLLRALRLQAASAILFPPAECADIWGTLWPGEQPGGEPGRVAAGRLREAWVREWQWSKEWHRHLAELGRLRDLQPFVAYGVSYTCACEAYSEIGARAWSLVREAAGTGEPEFGDWQASYPDRWERSFQQLRPAADAWFDADPDDVIISAVELEGAAVGQHSADVGDPTAYRPATEFLGDEIRTYKQLDGVLGANPSIRSRKPSPQRRLIHAGDMMDYIRKKRVGRFESADDAPAAQAINEAARRVRDANRARQHGG
jgi:hypothetical protein